MPRIQKIDVSLLGFTEFRTLIECMAENLEHLPIDVVEKLHDFLESNGDCDYSEYAARVMCIEVLNQLRNRKG